MCPYLVCHSKNWLVSPGIVAKHCCAATVFLPIAERYIGSDRLQILQFIGACAPRSLRHITVNATCSTLSQAGSWKRAMILLAEMYAKGMRPAGFAVAATIRACSAAGEWTKGLEVLRQSQQVEPRKPDPCSLGTAIEMCCRAGELVSAYLLTFAGIGNGPRRNTHRWEWPNKVSTEAIRLPDNQSS